ncbi:hypothetical protein SBOR_8821 [Sclerotinia borealis F-4128]|uniref:F-box domain-containing protein n=1 Tax=Sclerotinia borealis (strain F-4128) TaxID=1432307 RepID=W9C203_SCLBF|nr:hypothetical protein SBOR_8821 [Sclerotinia borealis F-4128]
MSRAAHAVFSIHELVEQILLDLPLTDLLVRIQRVNKIFHTIVDTSPPLQRKLFFASDTTTSGSTTRYNPLVHQWFHAYVKPERSTRAYLYGLPVDANRIKFERTRAFMYEDASWRRMLAVVPTVTSVMTTIQYKNRLVKNKGGVRMGDLDYFIPVTRWGSLDDEGCRCLICNDG